MGYYRKRGYQPWFNNYRKKFRPDFSYRDFFREEFDFGYNCYERNDSKPKRDSEFRVPPVFDHIFPRYEIRLETQYYFGYLSLRLKSEKAEHIEALRKGVMDFTGNDIVYISRTNSDNTSTRIYSNPLREGLPNDPPRPCFQKLMFNGRDVCRYAVNLGAGSDDSRLEKFLYFLQHYLTDTLGKPLKDVRSFLSTYEDKLSRVKKGYYSDPNLIIEKYQPSGLEGFFAEALAKNQVKVEHQVKILFHNQVLTIADFFIRDAKIAIYCDGFKYHSNNQKMTIDRRQDRILQNMDYLVMRFTDSEIESDIQGIIQEIRESIRLRMSGEHYHESQG